MRSSVAVPFWLALAVVASLVPPSLAQQPMILKLSHFLGPASFFEADFAQPWARELEAKTGGKVQVEVYNASSPFGRRGVDCERVGASPRQA